METTSFTYRCKSVRFAGARQERTEGWSQDLVAEAGILVVGAGGAGGEVFEGLVRTGYGNIHIVDPDVVSPTDLNRQKFSEADLYSSKAERLCERASNEWGYLGSRLFAYQCPVQSLELGTLDLDLVVCCVDNKIPFTRRWITQECARLQIPCVFVAVSTCTLLGYCFIQEPNSACGWCFLEDQETHGATSCPESPAVIDVLKTWAGTALYAVGSIILGRPRDWNLRIGSLSDSKFGSSRIINPRIDCPVCQGGLR